MANRDIKETKPTRYSWEVRKAGGSFELCEWHTTDDGKTWAVARTRPAELFPITVDRLTAWVQERMGL